MKKSIYGNSKLHAIYTWVYTHAIYQGVIMFYTVLMHEKHSQSLIYYCLNHTIASYMYICNVNKIYRTYLYPIIATVYVSGKATCAGCAWAAR